MPDAIFPALHIRPSAGWLNDPNGVCRIDGTYHVFFQYNPDRPVHDDIAWGHVTSTDLVRWQEAPVALRPRPGLIDAAGCWSGCIVDDAGTPTAVYTAVPDHAWNAGVTLARSDRTLVEWQQDEESIVETPDRPGIGEVRDPFVFHVDGRRYAVQGAGERFGRPQLLLYDASDLANWIELDPLLTDADPYAATWAAANIWECPNLALVDGRWVLLISLWRWIDDFHELAGVRYLVGDLVPHAGGLRFRSTSGGIVDDGPAFYAPQLTADDGRVLLWGWSWEVGRSDAQVQQAGWAGVLTFPRELSIDDGVLCARPAAELVALRGEPLDQRPGDRLAPGAYEVVLAGPGRLQLDGHDVVRAEGSPTSPARIFVDGSLVEVYAGGRTYTTRAYPEPDSHWAVSADHATIYPLRLPG